MRTHICKCMYIYIEIKIKYIYIVPDWRVYTWLCTKIKVRPTCYQSRRNRTSVFSPASMWTASPLGTTHVSLEAFLATQNELQRCSQNNSDDSDVITRCYSKKTCVCINRLSMAIYIFASLHLCANPICSGNVPHSSSCLSWHQGSCRQENDLQPVDICRTL